ncbi:M42 family metallopeptidase [Ferdinandcohnia sp. Marseille-Q9671]
MEQVKQYIKELTSIPGISSREDEVISYMVKALKPYGDQIEIDPLGNVTCSFYSDVPNPKKLMLFAHMDEIGFIVRKVEENGFLRVERIGGVHVNVLPGLKVDVICTNGVLPGLIGATSHHFTKQDQKGKVPTDGMYVDIGARSRQHAKELGVTVGSFITYHSDFTELACDLIANKAMDNRAACACLLLLAQELSKIKDKLQWDIHLVACVQEEFNIRGIMPVVRKLSPDVSIGIDVTPSCDTPDMNGYSDVVLGNGPAITCMNFHGRGTLAGVLPDQRLFTHIVTIAEEQHIPLQHEVALGVITENAFISFAEQGIMTAGFSIPTRYTHTPIETISLSDVKALIHVLFHFLQSLTTHTSFGKQYLLEKGGAQ